jgi:hypothetical protein
MDRSHHIRIAPPDTPSLVREWLLTRRAFEAFHHLLPAQRHGHLGRMFERLAPWIQRGVRVVAMRHFLVLPEELLLARVFARAMRRDRLHDTHPSFALWIEASVLRDLADPADQLGVVHGASGEPSPLLQRRFNSLASADRALLFLYLVEGRDRAQVARATGIPADDVTLSLSRAWNTLTDGVARLDLPRAWRRPDFLDAGASVVREREREPGREREGEA